MDDAARIETFKRWLRIKYASNANGLKAYIATLGDGEAADSVVINNHQFEDGGASGQLVLEPMAKMQAALDVLAEMEPASAAEAPDYAYVRFSTPPPVTS